MSFGFKKSNSNSSMDLKFFGSSNDFSSKRIDSSTTFDTFGSSVEEERITERNTISFGLLYKKKGGISGNFVKAWSKYFFAITNHRIVYYYQNVTSISQISGLRYDNSISLKFPDVTVVVGENIKTSPTKFVFHITSKTGKFDWILAASSKIDLKRWIDDLSPFTKEVVFAYGFEGFAKESSIQKNFLNDFRSRDAYDVNTSSTTIEDIDIREKIIQSNKFPFSNTDTRYSFHSEISESSNISSVQPDGPPKEKKIRKKKPKTAPSPPLNPHILWEGWLHKYEIGSNYMKNRYVIVYKDFLEWWKPPLIQQNSNIPGNAHQSSVLSNKTRSGTRDSMIDQRLFHAITNGITKMKVNSNNILSLQFELMGCIRLTPNTTVQQAKDGSQVFMVSNSLSLNNESLIIIVLIVHNNDVTEGQKLCKALTYQMNPTNLKSTSRDTPSTSSYFQDLSSPSRLPPQPYILSQSPERPPTVRSPLAAGSTYATPHTLAHKKESLEREHPPPPPHPQELSPTISTHKANRIPLANRCHYIVVSPEGLPVTPRLNPQTRVLRHLPRGAIIPVYRRVEYHGLIRLRTDDGWLSERTTEQPSGTLSNSMSTDGHEVNYSEGGRCSVIAVLPILPLQFHKSLEIKLVSYKEEDEKSTPSLFNFLCCYIKIPQIFLQFEISTPYNYSWTIFNTYEDCNQLYRNLQLIYEQPDNHPSQQQLLYDLCTLFPMDILDNIDALETEIFKLDKFLNRLIYQIDFLHWFDLYQFLTPSPNNFPVDDDNSSHFSGRESSSLQLQLHDIWSKTKQQTTSTSPYAHGMARRRSTKQLEDLYPNNSSSHSMDDPTRYHLSRFGRVVSGSTSGNSTPRVPDLEASSGSTLQPNLIESTLLNILTPHARRKPGNRPPRQGKYEGSQRPPPRPDQQQQQQQLGGLLGSVFRRNYNIVIGSSMSGSEGGDTSRSPSRRTSLAEKRSVSSLADLYSVSTASVMVTASAGEGKSEELVIGGYSGSHRTGQSDGDKLSSQEHRRRMSILDTLCSDSDEDQPLHTSRYSNVNGSGAREERKDDSAGQSITPDAFHENPAKYLLEKMDSTGDVVFPLLMSPKATGNTEADNSGLSSRLVVEKRGSETSGEDGYQTSEREEGEGRNSESDATGDENEVKSEIKGNVSFSSVDVDLDGDLLIPAGMDEGGGGGELGGSGAGDDVGNPQKVTNNPGSPADRNGLIVHDNSNFVKRGLSSSVSPSKRSVDGIGSEREDSSPLLNMHFGFTKSPSKYLSTSSSDYGLNSSSRDSAGHIRLSEQYVYNSQQSIIEEGSQTYTADEIDEDERYIESNFMNHDRYNTLEYHLWEVLQLEIQSQWERIEFDADMYYNNYMIEPSVFYGTTAAGHSGKSLMSDLNSNCDHSITGAQISNYFRNEDGVPLFPDDELIPVPIELRLPKLRFTSIALENMKTLKKKSCPKTTYGSGRQEDFTRSSSRHRNGTSKHLIKSSSLSYSSYGDGEEGGSDGDDDVDADDSGDNEEDSSRVKFIPMVPTDPKFASSLNRKFDLNLIIKLREIHELMGSLLQDQHEEKKSLRSKDLFVLLRVNDQLHSSSIKMNTNNPSWESSNQEFLFYINSQVSSYLIIEVFDWDWFWKDAFLGSVAICLNKLIFRKGNRRIPIDYERTILGTTKHSREVSYEVVLSVSVFGPGKDVIKRHVYEVYEYEVWTLEEGWSAPPPPPPNPSPISVIIAPLNQPSHCYHFMDRDEPNRIHGNSLEEVSNRISVVDNWMVERDWTLYHGHSMDPDGWCYSHTFESDNYHAAEVQYCLFRRRLWRRFYKQLY